MPIPFRLINSATGCEAPPRTPPPGPTRAPLAFRGQRGRLRGLDGLDLVDQQFEPVDLPADLGLQMHRQRLAVARAQLLEPLAAVAPQRLIVAYSLREQKPLDPVGVHDPLVDQRLALATKPPTSSPSGEAATMAQPAARPLEGQQRSQQRLTVDPVRLGPSPAARRRDRGGVDHMALAPLLPQNPVHPEPSSPASSMAMIG